MQYKLWSKFQSEKFVSRIFFAALLLLGLCIYSDYGVSTDEWQQRQIGLTSLNFIASLFESFLPGTAPGIAQNPSDIFRVFTDRDYGVVFELPAEFLISIFNIQGPNVYHFRHLLTFLVFYCATIAMYRIARYRFSNWQMGLLAVAFLILSPRIFGDAFYNDKDLVFLSTYLIATLTLLRLALNPSIKQALWHALATAIAIDTRVTGVILAAATLTILSVLVIKKELKWRAFLKILFTYTVFSILFVILFWPWLWLDPLVNFQQAFKNMANFRWGGAEEGDGLFFGKYINSRNLPWYFIPGWIIATTPILYLALAPIGIIKTLFNLVRAKFNLWTNRNELQDLIYLGLFATPLIAVIALNSTLYNGWRQMFFIYPAFLMLSLVGLNALWVALKNYLVIRKALVLLVLSSCMWISYWTVKWHPYEYLYFNVIAKDWSRQFDLDYWGSAFRRPLEKIVNRDDRDSYVIYDGRGITWGIWMLGPYRAKIILPPEKMNKIDNHQSEACSDYIFTTILGPWKQYSAKNEFELFDELMVDGKIIYQTWSRKTPLQSLYNPKTLQEIAFSDPNSKCFLKEGWSMTEDWGIWSTGAKSKLTLPLPSKHPKFLILTLKSFTSKQAPSQTISIQVANSPKQSIKVGSLPADFKISIQNLSIDEKNLEVTFETPDSKSPKMIGLGDDSRMLGVGLVKARYQ